MDDFNFNDDRNLKTNFLKKIGIITVVFIVIFLIVRGCNNFLSNKIREDINKDKVVNTEKEKKDEIDLNKPFSYYKITNDNELHELIRKISLYLTPSKLQKYVDYDLYSLKYFDWNDINNMYGILNNMPKGTYANLLEQLLDNKVNYDEAPLTEHFKEKFKDGLLIEYANLDINNSFSWIKYDFENRYFTLQANIGEAVDYYYFNFILDQDGYLDDIVLEKIVPMYDEEGIYIPKKDSILMNNEENIKLIISQVLLSEDAYYFEGDWEYDERKSPQSRYNRFKEFGFTDRFREYYASLNEKGIIEEEIDSDEGDTIEIIDINIENKTAVAKLVFHKLNIIKYYDVSWSTDDKYRLDTINVIFNREENK